jgi:hypothetical protein
MSAARFTCYAWAGVPASSWMFPLTSSPLDCGRVFVLTEIAGGGVHVLVATTGQVHEDQPVLPSSAPTSRALASAWALSIAGMMPSVDASSRNACIAASSVTGRYSPRPMSCKYACSGPMPG